MAIKELLYKTPEMTEEKLLELIDKYKNYLKPSLLKILEDSYHVYKMDARTSIQQAILKEWDLIQEKKSNLSKNQRDQICSLVSVCLIKMTKGDE